MPFFRLPLLALFTAVLSAGVARAAGDPEKGRDIAVKHCSRCHVIGDYNPYGGIGSTPSFPLLLKMDDWRDRFATFFDRRPHPVHVRVQDVPKWTNLPPNAKEITITLENIDDLLAFVENMAAKQLR